MRVETGENGSRSFERIDPGLRHGGMRLLSRDRYVEVQATVMRGHHRIGKSCCNHSVGFCQLLFQEPLRAKTAARLFVVGEMQFDSAANGEAALHCRLECK